MRDEYYSIDDLKWEKNRFKTESMDMCEDCTYWYDDKIKQLTNPYYDFTCECGFVRAHDMITSTKKLDNWVYEYNFPNKITCEECDEWIKIKRLVLSTELEDEDKCTCKMLNWYLNKGYEDYCLTTADGFEAFEERVKNWNNLCDVCEKWLTNQKILYKILNDRRTSWKER